MRGLTLSRFHLHIYDFETFLKDPAEFIFRNFVKLQIDKNNCYQSHLG